MLRSNDRCIEPRLELSIHPEWSSKLRDEIDRVVGEEDLKVTHLKQLVQLGYLLKEIERLYPPPFFIPRGVVEQGKRI